MATNKQTMDVRVGGLDLGSQTYAVDAPSSLVCEDVSFTKDGAATKRRPFSPDLRYIDAPESDSASLLSASSGRLCVIRNGGSSSSDKYSNRALSGLKYPFSRTRSTSASGGAKTMLDAASCAPGDGRLCYFSWIDDDNSLTVVAVETATGLVLSTRTFDGFSFNCSMATSNDRVFLYYTQGASAAAIIGTLSYVIINPASEIEPLGGAPIAVDLGAGSVNLGAMEMYCASKSSSHDSHILWYELNGGVSYLERRNATNVYIVRVNTGLLGSLGASFGTSLDNVGVIYSVAGGDLTVYTESTLTFVVDTTLSYPSKLDISGTPIIAGMEDGTVVVVTGCNLPTLTDLYGSLGFAGGDPTENSRLRTRGLSYMAGYNTDVGSASIGLVWADSVPGCQPCSTATTGIGGFSFVASAVVGGNNGTSANDFVLQQPHYAVVNCTLGEVFGRSTFAGTYSIDYEVVSMASVDTARPITVVGTADVAGDFQNKIISLHSDSGVIPFPSAELSSTNGTALSCYTVDISYSQAGGALCNNSTVLFPSGNHSTSDHESVFHHSMPGPGVLGLIQDNTIESPPTVFVPFGYKIGTSSTVPPFGLSKQLISCCFRYIDANGNVYRTAPSSLMSVSYQNLYASFGGSQYSARIAVPLPWLPRTLFRNMDLEVYTALPDLPSGDSVPRLYSAERVVTSDETGHAYATFLFGNLTSGADTEPTLVITPTSVIDGVTELYTQTELSNDMIGPVSSASVSSTSCVAASQLGSIYYSKPIVDRVGVSFNSLVSTPPPSSSPQYVASSQIDDKYLLLTNSEVFTQFGSPPDAEGNSSTLTPVAYLSSDVGCVDPNSVVSGPFGVCFNSARGFCVVDRGLSIKNIGKRVLPLSQGNDVIWSMIVPSSYELWYGMSNDVVMVWNYEKDMWSTHTTQAIGAIRLTDGSRVCLQQDGVFIRQSDGDGGTVQPAALNIQTAWVKPSGQLEGYLRVRRVSALSLASSGGSQISISCSSNYRSAADTSATFGREEFSSASVKTVVLYPTVQKLDSISVSIQEDAQDFGTLEIVGISLDVTVKNGTFKSVGSGSRG